MSEAANDAPERGENIEAGCGNCPFAGTTQDPGMMLCHRYPPQVVVVPRQISTRDQLQGTGGVSTPVPQTIWPIVPASEICGEHPMLAVSIAEEVDRMRREAAAQRRGGKNGKRHPRGRG